LKPLTLTLPVALTIGLGVATTAGAGVRWGIDTPTFDTRCDGRNAITQLETNLDGRPLHTGDTIQATWAARPGCEATNIRVAAHATGSLAFNEHETQPLIQASAAVLAGAGRIVYTIPQGIEPGCQVQVDLITGDPLPAVSPTARYNEFAIGGNRSRLIAAGYAAGECTPPDTTTTSSTPDTWNPPTTIQVSNSIPIPETPTTVTFPTVDQTTPDLTPSPPPAEGPGSPELLTQTRLPETGVDTGALIWSGALTTAAGMFALALSALRRRTIKENQP
jgi:hypothetical protein